MQCSRDGYRLMAGKRGVHRQAPSARARRCRIRLVLARRRLPHVPRQTGAGPGEWKMPAGGGGTSFGSASCRRRRNVRMRRLNERVQRNPNRRPARIPITRGSMTPSDC